LKFSEKITVRAALPKRVLQLKHHFYTFRHKIDCVLKINLTKPKTAATFPIKK
jgi:hypothetical protein